MPARKIPMRKVRETLRLSLDCRLPYDLIAQTLGLSKGVISKYTRQAIAAGLDWSAIEAMDEGELHRKLRGQPSEPVVFVAPDYGLVHLELRGKGVTLMLLWQEYCAKWAQKRCGRHWHRTQTGSRSTSRPARDRTRGV
jgi:hypothetical protein